ncbi:MAG: hypothetical protein ACK5C5_07355 [Bacteroidota bacterium]
MIRSYFVILLLLWLPCYSYGQEPKSVLVLKNDDKGWEVDDLKQIYVYDKYEIRKYSEDGQKMASFSVRELGPIGSLDVSDPLNPILYLPSFYTVLELDNQLSVTSKWTVDHISDPSAFWGCRSNGPGYWFYNSLTSEPIQLNQKGKVLSIGTKTSSFLEPSQRISGLYAKDAWLVVKVLDVGMLIYDQFGTYSRTIVDESTSFSGIYKNDLFYWKPPHLNRFDLKTGIRSKWVYKGLESVKDVRVVVGRLYYAKDKTIYYSDF